MLFRSASSQTEEIKRLAQQNALLEHRVRRLEEAVKTGGAAPDGNKPADGR